MKRLDQYSQYFLRSPRLVLELIGHSNLKKRDLVLDIGAGSGVISAALAKKVARVIAIESDVRLLAKLKANLGRLPKLEIVRADFMKYHLPKTEYKVFANIPFHLSSPIVRKLAMAVLPPRAIYLIVQKQFAKKLMIDDFNFTSQLGASLAPWWQIRIRRPLKKDDFMPRPNVDTVLLEIKARSRILLPLEERRTFGDFTMQCFTQQQLFERLKMRSDLLDKTKKASELNTDEWLELYHLD